MKSILLLASLGLATLLATTLKWTIAEDYVVKFDTSGAEGTFSGLKGEVVFDPSDLAAANIDVTVDVATISTGNETKDKHARNDSWFDAEQYPTIRFASQNFTELKEGYSITGELTLHGTTRVIAFPFTFEETATGGQFNGSFQVDRKDYGIKGNLFGFAVGKTVDIELKIPVSKK